MPSAAGAEDILNVQADGRLATHLRETPAPHIMEEDAEPNEDLAGNVQWEQGRRSTWVVLERRRSDDVRDWST